MSETALRLQKLEMPCAAASSAVKELATLADRTAELAAQLGKALANIPHNGDARETACAYRALAAEEMARLRCAVDQLEEAMPETAWPIPGYSDLLFDL